ncbi:hypothetical protein ACJZ2D_006920 [Fusarium nematophilum]
MAVASARGSKTDEASRSASTTPLLTVSVRHQLDKATSQRIAASMTKKKPPRRFGITHSSVTVPHPGLPKAGLSFLDPLRIAFYPQKHATPSRLPLLTLRNQSGSHPTHQLGPLKVRVLIAASRSSVATPIRFPTACHLDGVDPLVLPCIARNIQLIRRV